MLKNNLLRKTIILEIVLLFLGAGIVTGINTNFETTDFCTNNEKITFDIKDFTPSDDVYIKHNKPEITCNIKYMSIRNEYGIYGSPNWAWDGLIKFDVSSIPSGAKINSAILNMYYWSFQDTNPAGRILLLYRPLNNWDETSVTWYTQPSYASEPSAFSVVPSSFGWMTWNVTDDVQDFVKGKKDNHGWKITDEGYWGMPDIPTTRFHTKDIPEFDDLIPHLEINYKTPRNINIDVGVLGKLPLIQMLLQRLEI